jgi:hypothetical protein
MATHRPRSFADISKSLRDFGASDDTLLSPGQMQQYASNWVAVHGAQVVAVASTLPAIREQLRTDGIPIAEAAIRFIEKDGLAAA